MRAVEFDTSLEASGQISVPPEVANEILPGERVRVVLMWGPSDSDAAWRAAGRQRFEDAYSPEDAVYERLLDDVRCGYMQGKVG